MEKKIVAIKGGLLIDGTGKPHIENVVVVIEGSVIKAVDKEEEVKIPEEAEVIDAAGKTVMPGMIDAHVHLASVSMVTSDAARNAAYAILKTPAMILGDIHRTRHIAARARSDAVYAILAARAQSPLLQLHAAKNAREMLEAGFTAVRDCILSKEYQRFENISVKLAIDLGLIPGPRIVACSWVENAGPEDPRCADGPWEMRKRVREAARAGADQIKATTAIRPGKSGPLGHSGGLIRSQTKEEFAALVDEAHANGMPVMCHSHTTADAMMHAIEAGVDTIEHAIPLTDTVIQMLVKNNIIIVPTLVATGGFISSSQPPERVAEAEKRRVARFAEVGKAHKAGVKIAMGTDSHSLLPDWSKNTYELQCLVEAGMTEMEAIISTTKTAAEALGFENQIGTIEKGKLADIIIVDGNPLKDIKILQDNEKILYVIKNGDIVVDRLNKGGALIYYR